MPLPLVLCTHLSTLIFSCFCSSQFYVSVLHSSVLLCSFPVIFYINLYNRNFFPLFSFLLQICFTHIHRQNRTQKKIAQPKESFNFISRSIPSFYFLFPRTSLALIMTEIYLFGRIILHTLEAASTPSNVQMVNKGTKNKTEVVRYIFPIMYSNKHSTGRPPPRPRHI